MFYLADFGYRKTRSDKGKKRKLISSKKKSGSDKRKEGQKILSSVNRTSEELRGWTNTAMRLKRLIDGNF